MSATTDNLSYLPNWKKGATPDERFMELAMIARKHPERFARILVLYEENLPNGNTLMRWAQNGCLLNDMLALLVIAQQQILEDQRPK